jgi:hypothetical protein
MEVQIGQFRVLLQDSDIRPTEAILAQPLAEQIEWYRWRGAAGQGLAINLDGIEGSFGRDREWPSSQAKDHARDV